ncbi:glycosyltransferase family 25 protein [Lentithecium fluviatile CBS 122367]|uniref:Glycosyltransferase family 25 protein n=1 Tax=Lentithecium fluviatile CBS 122367 TaxID=1168545 RepID=A0A6G1J848_9PLEO|nr:glycosyltransferase family 25 protein [Lentithecium fluviatile CBS 122367]
MLAPSRKRPLPLLLALTTTFLLFLYHRHDRIYLRLTTHKAQDVDLPANSTLGFGAVVVVSRDGSERRHSLLQAANVTDIELTIPQQPQWTDGDVEKFRGQEEEGVEKGSVLAWMGHHNVLQWFLDSDLETVLVLEDDVDWDIRLRSVQIPLAARAARSVLPPMRPLFPFKPRANHAQYWGDHEAWDLLYLGHCGDYFDEVTNEGPVSSADALNLTDHAHVVYQDFTLPARRDLHPFTQTLFDALQLPPHSRAFHRSRSPLCSFGYAVTRPAAERLLNDLAPGPSNPQDEDGAGAFDVALLHACVKGSKTPSPTPWRTPHPYPEARRTHRYANPGLRCWTLNSELFHHVPGASEIARVNAADGKIFGVPPVDLAGQAQVDVRNETSNIDCGFWSGDFAFEDGDMETLRFLQEEVGRKGRCLKEDGDEG